MWSSGIIFYTMLAGGLAFGKELSRCPRYQHRRISLNSTSIFVQVCEVFEMVRNCGRYHGLVCKGHHSRSRQSSQPPGISLLVLSGPHHDTCSHPHAVSPQPGSAQTNHGSASSCPRVLPRTSISGRSSRIACYRSAQNGSIKQCISTS